MVLLLVLLSKQWNVSALEATFTAAPDKDTGSTDGPLPQSQNQRNQLSQLYQQIASSPNPQETLQKVAEGNGMTAQELGDLLMRNERDMQMAAGGSGGMAGGAINSLPRRMIRLFSTLVVLVGKSASAHPRSSSVISLALIVILYIALSAPRTGVMLSTKPGMFSSGHSTLLPPPSKYLSNYLESDTFQNMQRKVPKSAKEGSLIQLFRPSTEEEQGVFVEKLSSKQKKKLSLAVSAKKKVPFEVLLPSEEELEDMYEPNDEEDRQEALMELEDKAWEDTMILAFAATENVLSGRRYSEYIPPSSNYLRFYSSPRNSKAVFVMKCLGDLGKFGLQPLHVVKEHQSDFEKSILYSTLCNGHFDGEIEVKVEKAGGFQDEEEERKVVVTVTLLVPAKGRKMKKKLASTFVENLAESIATSAMTEAKKTLSRKRSSASYRGRVNKKASSKRHLAHDTLTKMEEMAAERRRRWQRSNLNAGSYRPSGQMHRNALAGGPSRAF